MLFAIVDRQSDGNIVHQMQCSRILQTAAPTSSPDPSAIQVTIAVLLSAKDAFFRARNIRYGIQTGVDPARPPRRKAAMQGPYGRTPQTKGKSRAASASRTAKGFTAGITVCKYLVLLFKY